MAEHTTQKVLTAIQNRDLETILKALEDADRELTGQCLFAPGEYWRQFVEVDFQRFFKLLDKGGDAINSVKLGDGRSKIYISFTGGKGNVYINCPEDVGDKYEAIWKRIQ